MASNWAGWPFHPGQRHRHCAQHRERIFKMSQRLHTAQAHEGTGLGLSMCQRIVDGHAAASWLKPRPAVAASCALPFPNQDLTMHAQPLSRLSRNAVVLMAEDNDDHSFLARESFVEARLRADLHHVIDGIQCMAFLRREPLYETCPAPPRPAVAGPAHAHDGPP